MLLLFIYLFILSDTNNSLDKNVPSFKSVVIDGLTIDMPIGGVTIPPNAFTYFGGNLFRHLYDAELQVKYVELLYCIVMIYAKFDVWSTERVFATTSSLSLAELQDTAHNSLKVLTSSNDKLVKEYIEKYLSTESPLLMSIRDTAAKYEHEIVANAVSRGHA